jgi:hypothetical protein
MWWLYCYQPSHKYEVVVRAHIFEPWPVSPCIKVPFEKYLSQHHPGIEHMHSNQPLLHTICPSKVCAKHSVVWHNAPTTDRVFFLIVSDPIAELVLHRSLPPRISCSCARDYFVSLHGFTRPRRCHLDSLQTRCHTLECWNEHKFYYICLFVCSFCCWCIFLNGLSAISRFHDYDVSWTWRAWNEWHNWRTRPSYRWLLQKPSISFFWMEGTMWKASAES